MENLNDKFDKKITKHFREVFDDYEHDFKEGSWLKMQAKLDAELHLKSSPNWSGRILLLIFILSFSFLGHDCRQTSLKSESISQVSTKENSAVYASFLNAEMFLNYGKPKTSLTCKKTTDAQSSKAILVNKDVFLAEAKNGAKATNALYKKQDKLLLLAQNSDPKTSHDVATTSENAKSIVQNGLITTSENPITPSETLLLDTVAILAQEFMPLPTDSIKIKESIALSCQNQGITFLKDKVLRIGFGYSAIRNGDFNQSDNVLYWSSGHELSANLDWIISPDISLQTGVSWFNFNKKFFSKSDFWDFQNQIPTSNLPAIEKPSKEVRLSILNIPIDVRINLVNGKKMSFFTSIGVSNFIFLKEYYRGYEEEIISSTGGNSPDLTIKKNSVEQQRQSFDRMQFGSALNFSLGLEYKTSKCTSIQIEPFYRKPLGNGAIDLMYFHTLGARVRLNWLK